MTNEEAIKNSKDVLYFFAIYKTVEGEKTKPFESGGAVFRDYNKCRTTLIKLINDIVIMNPDSNYVLHNEKDFKCDFTFIDCLSNDKIHYRVEEVFKDVWK